MRAETKHAVGVGWAIVQAGVEAVVALEQAARQVQSVEPEREEMIEL